MIDVDEEKTRYIQIADVFSQDIVKGGFDFVVTNEAVICGLTPEKACNIKEFAA